MLLQLAKNKLQKQYGAISYEPDELVGSFKSIITHITVSFEDN
jgi:hypothetical protein